MVLLGYSTEQMMDRANVSRDVIRSRIARIFTAFNLNSREELRAKMLSIYNHLDIDYKKVAPHQDIPVTNAVIRIGCRSLTMNGSVNMNTG